MQLDSTPQVSFSIAFWPKINASLQTKVHALNDSCLDQVALSESCKNMPLAEQKHIGLLCRPLF